jgi:chromosome segregation protein
LDYLAGYGIVPHGYNVVMQGDINRIIEMSDFERRKIIDEIAGVAEFDAKKELALTELAQVRERMNEESVHIEELSVRLTQLEKQKEQAIQYRMLQDEQKYLAMCRSAARLAARKKDMETLLESIVEEKKLGDQIAGDIATKSKKRDLIRDEIVTIDQKIAAKTGSEYLALVSRIAEAKAAIDGLYRSLTGLEGILGGG